MKSLTNKLHGFLNIAGKTIDMEDLEKKSEEIISEYYKKGIDEFTIKLYVCVRGKYLYFSKYQVLGVERKTNKWVKLVQGVGPIIRYIVSLWKYQHARSTDVEWNVIKFSYDGYDLSINGTSFDDDVMKRAKEDARDGIIMRNARALMGFLNRATIGEIKPHKKKEDDDNHNDLGV
jgi:hypothetical protein